MPRKSKTRCKTSSPKGRRPKYTEQMPEQAYRLCLLGYTDSELAKFFEIAESTLNRWKHDFPAFWEWIKKGREDADSRVARGLYERAIGYSHPEDKIFCNDGEIIIQPTIKHYPPDVKAATVWLTNRQPERWREKIEVDSTNTNTNVNIEVTDEEQRKSILDEYVRRRLGKAGV